MLKELYKDKKEVENLSAALREFLDNPETLKKINGVIDFFKLGMEEQQRLKEIILKLAGGEINLYDIGPIISDELEIEFSEALDLNDKLYEELFAPIAGDLNAAYAARQTAAPAEISVVSEIDIEKSQKKKSEFASLMDKAVKKFNLSFAPASPSLDKEGLGEVDLKNRFYEIADSFLSSARTKVQFKNSLTKDVASGGLGWEKEKAGEVAEFFASYSRLQPVIAKSEEKIKKYIPAIPSEARNLTPQPNQPDATSPRAALGRNDMITFQPEEKEAEMMKEKMKTFKTAAPAGDIGKKINEAMQELNLDFPSSELNERLKAVIDARLRNVRTSVQTQEKLVLDVASGGLGLAKTDADRVSLALNKYLDAANKDLFQSKMSEKQEFEKQELAGKEEREKMEKEKETQDLNARFKKLTGKDPSLAVIPSAVKGSEVSGKEAPAAPAPATVPPPAPAPQKLKSIPIPAEEKPFAIESAKGKPVSPIKKSAPPAAAPLAAPRPAVEDIAFTPKLFGPLEEIGRMTLDDFRKLSADPKEVMLKIKDKLGLLRGESFKKYQAGIEVWRKSPVYTEYLKILEQSLSAGLPLAEILAKSKTLTQQEFDAIINIRVE